MPAQDIVRWKRTGQAHLVEQLVPGHFSEMAFASTDSGACIHLGTADNANACSIYSHRGSTCRDFEQGSRQCLEYRREAGIVDDG